LRITDAAAWSLVLLGLVVGIPGTVLTRNRRSSIGTMLDLWTAAGLLRLSADGTWESIALAAAVIAARHLLTSKVVTLARSKEARAGS
jgi:hypothetical protein